MILNFNQIDRQPNPVFEGRINDVLVISGKGSTQSNNGYIIYENERIDISSKPHRERINEKVATQVTDLCSNGNRIGYIYPDLVALKTFLFLSFGYDCFVFNFHNVDYRVYEVGLGADQHYICVYKNDKTVAIIKKEDIKINFCDRYTIYAEDNSNILALSVLTLYFDCVRYPDHGEIMDEARDDDSYMSVQKELNAKYDPTFIPRIKAMDGITE